MKLLAYDSSSEVLSVALFDGPKKLAEFRSPLFTRHSDILVPVIDRLLRRCRWKAGMLEYIAVGLGPGSFTGLRVGVTTAKFLSFATGAKLIGIPSLQVIAAQAETSKKDIVVTLDAKKGKIYAAVYKKDKSGVPEAIHGPMLTDEGVFMRNRKRPAVFLTPGDFPKATDLARIALEFIRRRKFSEARGLEPLYLHPKDCNVILPAKRRRLS